MSARDDFNNLIRDMLIGPYPLEGFTQDNGEEILFKDSPLNTYISGVLFPQHVPDDQAAMKDDSANDILANQGIEEKSLAYNGKELGDDDAPDNGLDTETSSVNNFKQSGIGITICVSTSSNLLLSFSGAKYKEGMHTVPVERKQEDGSYQVVTSDLERKCYFRVPITGNVKLPTTELPDASSRYKKYPVISESGDPIRGIDLCCTYRMKLPEGNANIYTFTVINSNTGSDKQISFEKCWFQVAFQVESVNQPFIPLPDNYCENIDDVDYHLNSMLYRDVKSYGIGHGCAATWNDTTCPQIIKAEVMPSYDVKPILPTKSSAELNMQRYMNEIEFAIKDLSILCSEYEVWIKGLENEKNSWISGNDEKLKSFASVAEHQIELCNYCLSRMRNGLVLLQSDNDIASAFMLMNRAMLMQQLHYRLPLREYKEYNFKNLELVLENDLVIPDPDDKATWYEPDKNTYGRWRPFQIAFILLNLESIANKKSVEREMVDLIWFPTGGGKTEAYLGLSAYSILLRRIKSPKAAGTAVIMRYTLRLLTSQQFSRAAALVCSLEKLRMDNPKLLGEDRISIGLWVGHKFEDSSLSDVRNKINQINKGKLKVDPGVLLKCPWCGASMRRFGEHTPGYDISSDKKRIVYRCGNSSCLYSSEDEKKTLPIELYDEEIYNYPPTVLFGTVDKFATIPFKPIAKKIFGGDNEYDPPELFIQDELHLITGPLGSTVGLYETMISEVCKRNGFRPKIVASTATISHAKQQCNALYACGEDKVFQFPVPGLSYRDNFFAEEKKDAVGRTYIGLYGNSTSSSAFASIFTFAAELYAANEIAPQNNVEKDPYFTNLAYFNSMRELGQAATWLSADIRERLETIYDSRLKKHKTGRRYIYDNRLAELTSRMENEEIPEILQKLEYSFEEPDALDICLATNMVSVGVDVPRLGLMTVTGQPKSMSEYIQTTSRIGRNKPGSVIVIYNTSKPRDRSHYEKFQNQHSKLYFSVEPTSVTPFSRPLRERAIAAIFVGLYRLLYNPNNCVPPTQTQFDDIVDIITSRSDIVDSSETLDIKNQLNKLYKEWCHQSPQKYSCNMINPDPDATLVYPAGSEPPKSWAGRGWPIPNSMRNVDRECRLDCSKLLT